LPAPLATTALTSALASAAARLHALGRAQLPLLRSGR
jgi:hypothetical protein